MKYYVVYVINGALQTGKITEWVSIDEAKSKFHTVCASLVNEKSVETATVAILNVRLAVTEGNLLYIDHREPEPEN